jgi:hypothetical protein
MRGWDAKSDALFNYVSCEARVPKDHPLCTILEIVDEAAGGTVAAIRAALRQVRAAVDSA